jgi:hypothetical protein
MNNMDLQVITHEDKSEGVYVNGKLIGHVMRFEDGYYAFMNLEGLNGSWSSYDLRMIADLLDDLNKPWDTEVKAYFDSIEVEDASDDEILPF